MTMDFAKSEQNKLTQTQKISTSSKMLKKSEIINNPKKLLSGRQIVYMGFECGIFSLLDQSLVLS